VTFLILYQLTQKISIGEGGGGGQEGTTKCPESFDTKDIGWKGSLSKIYQKGH